MAFEKKQKRKAALILVLAASAIIVLAAVLALIFGFSDLTGSKGTVTYQTNGYSAPRLASAKAVTTSNYSADSMFVAEEALEASAVFYDKADSASGLGFETEPAPNPEKKLIKTGDLSLEVESLSDTMTAIGKWVASFGGYVSSSNQYSTSLNMVAHIPQDKFDAAMEEAGDFGRIVYKTVSSRDVTEEYYDLETRLETKRILLEKLQGYLLEAKNISEIMEVESKISTVTAELERMQGQINRLSKQVNYSQIYIYAALPSNYNEDGFILPDTKSEFRDFVSNLINFGLQYVISALYILLCGTLIVLLLIFLYWLCFGKLGLVRRLFNKVK